MIIVNYFCSFFICLAMMEIKQKATYNDGDEETRQRWHTVLYMCTFANVAILTCTWALWWVQSVSVQAPVWLWYVHRWHLWFLPSPTVVWHKSAQNRNMSITGVTKAVLDKMLPKKARFEREEHLCQPEMRNLIIHKHQEVRVQRNLDRKDA